jgi:hypothetical protein
VLVDEKVDRKNIKIISLEKMRKKDENSLTNPRENIREKIWDYQKIPKKIFKILMMDRKLRKKFGNF